MTQWSATTGRQPTNAASKCHSCGAFVSTRFARVFGDNQDQVHGCPECMTSTQLFDGQAVKSL